MFKRAYQIQRDIFVFDDLVMVAVSGRGVWELGGDVVRKYVHFVLFKVVLMGLGMIYNVSVLLVRKIHKDINTI
jgi:hypothetical protein